MRTQNSLRARSTFLARRACAVVALCWLGGCALELESAPDVEGEEAVDIQGKYEPLPVRWPFPQKPTTPLPTIPPVSPVTPPAVPSKADERPNILLIVADDLGYSDLGAFGSEIRTPNLDRLAQSGRLLTSHHSGQTCSPTRAMLISGADPHLVGVGAMSELIWPEQRGKPGYEGYLNKRALSVAELLSDSGYHTYITGKWHLGTTEQQSPKAWGFESSFVLAQGSSSHFAPDPKRPTSANADVTFRENGAVATVPPDFFSTDFYTDKLLGYLAAHEGDGRPFFAFAAYTAPHVPLQAPDAFIDRYKGRYDAGYARIREARIARQRELGVIPADFQPSPALPSSRFNPDWDRLSAEEKKTEARAMEVYAAMVENLDHNVGRILTYLEETGQYDNTFVFFQSDNGPEGNATTIEERDSDNSYANIGRRYSNVAYGKRWAEVSATPFRSWKAHSHEGGLSVPAIARLPRQRDAAAPFAALTHVLDLAPTFLDLARAEAPATVYKGRSVHPMSGLSLLPGLSGNASSIHPASAVFAEELYGRRSVRRDQWKLLFSEAPSGSGQWQLYDLARDRGERTDLARSRPDIVRELKDEWTRYAKRVGVVLPFFTGALELY